MCRHGPCAPISSLGPWEGWIPPDLHGFYKWVFDSLEVLKTSSGRSLSVVEQVVVNRRDAGVRKWTDWLREDLPYAWLRPDFVPPSSFLGTLGLSRLRFWLSLISLMLSSAARPGCLSSVGLAILLLLLTSFWDLWVIFYLRNLSLLPRITERDLQEVAQAKKSTAGGLDGWAWNEIKALYLPWFSGLAILLELVETTGVWPQGLLDAYIAMIPKADGVSTPLCQCAPVCVQAVRLPSAWTSSGVG